MELEQIITEHIRKSISVKESILSNPAIMASIKDAATATVDAYKRGKKTLIAGNGGSAADAQIGRAHV